jgi:hypothetical protein
MSLELCIRIVDKEVEVKEETVTDFEIEEVEVGRTEVDECDRDVVFELVVATVSTGSIVISSSSSIAATTISGTEYVELGENVASHVKLDMLKMWRSATSQIPAEVHPPRTTISAPMAWHVCPVRPEGMSPLCGAWIQVKLGRERIHMSLKGAELYILCPPYMYIFCWDFEVEATTAQGEMREDGEGPWVCCLVHVWVAISKMSRRSIRIMVVLVPPPRLTKMPSPFVPRVGM